MRDKLKTFLHWFTPLAVWFALLFSGLRVYESFAAMDHAEKLRLQSNGFLYDWPFASVLVSIVLLLSLTISLVHARAGRIVALSVFTLLLIVGFCLVHYFTVTNVLLSTDLFAYTMADLETTVSSSGSFSMVTVAFLLIYVAIFTAGVFWLWKHAEIPLKFSMITMALIVVVAFLPIAPTYDDFKTESDYNLVENKSRYFYTNTARYIREESTLFSNVTPDSNKPFPLLQQVNTRNVLGKYISKPDSLPNLVFVLVEGLGKDFVGENAEWGGFTPFLDSLSRASLFWPNALSNAGRTFGALPSVMGSLPYGKNGFMDYGVNMPDHHSLLSILKTNGYQTHFFYGGNPDFDRMDLFLQYQGTDYTLNESNFPPSYHMEKTNPAYAWGFPDRDVFRVSLEILNERPRQPRADVYLTLSTHEPFVSPEKKFDDVAATRINTELDGARREQLNEFKGVFTCLLYTDDALREFIQSYKQRPEYTNTIFIITGDHRLVPVPQRSKLSRFQVPLLIWSPLLREGKTFRSVVTHSDIFPSLLSYLSEECNLKHPSRLPFLSQGLQTDTTFSSRIQLGLMRSKGSVQDFIDGEYFLSEGHLFKIDQNMDLAPANDHDVRSKLNQKLRTFAWESRMVCEENRLDSLNRPNPLKQFTFTSSEKEIIDDENLDDHNPEEIFHTARSYALNKEFDKSRILLRYLLNEKPNFHDARVLLSRTFAWNKEFDTARVFLKQVLDRSPYYEDAFTANSDISYWKGDVNDASQWAEKGLLYHPASLDLLARRARALVAAGASDQAKSLVATILKQDPKHELALEIHQKLNP